MNPFPHEQGILYTTMACFSSGSGSFTLVSLELSVLPACLECHPHIIVPGHTPDFFADCSNVRNGDGGSCYPFYVPFLEFSYWSCCITYEPSGVSIDVKHLAWMFSVFALEVTMAECNPSALSNRHLMSPRFTLCWEVGSEMKVEICVCLFRVHTDVEAAVFHSFYEGVQEW